MSTNESEDTFINTLSFLVTLANIATTVFLSQMLYVWLLVPSFPSLPALNYWQTYGVLLAARFFGSSVSIPDTKNNTATDRAARGFAVFFCLWFICGLAFLVKSLAN